MQFLPLLRCKNARLHTANNTLFISQLWDPVRASVWSDISALTRSQVVAAQCLFVGEKNSSQPFKTVSRIVWSSCSQSLYCDAGLRQLLCLAKKTKPKTKLLTLYISSRNCARTVFAFMLVSQFVQFWGVFTYSPVILVLRRFLFKL